MPLIVDFIGDPIAHFAAAPQDAAAPAPPACKQSTSRRQYRPLALQPFVIEAPAPQTDVVVPKSELVTIVELRESMCRLPPFGGNKLLLEAG
jgi:hypothetical protein